MYWIQNRLNIIVWYKSNARNMILMFIFYAVCKYPYLRIMHVYTEPRNVVLGSSFSYRYIPRDQVGQGQAGLDRKYIITSPGSKSKFGKHIANRKCSRRTESNNPANNGRKSGIMRQFGGSVWASNCGIYIYRSVHPTCHHFSLCVVKLKNLCCNKKYTRIRNIYK